MGESVELMRSLREAPADRAAIGALRERLRSVAPTPVPSRLLALAEDRLGLSLRDVRIRHLPELAAAGIAGLAMGDEVCLAAPLDAEDRRCRFLLGHELAHVAQQRRGRGRSATAPAPALEDAADRVGAHLAAGHRPPPHPSASLAAGSPSVQFNMLSHGNFGGLKPNDRDNPPNGWKRTRLEPDIDWKYHHVIAWADLRDTWQGLLEMGDFEALTAYAMAVGVRAPRAVIAAMRSQAGMSQPVLGELYTKLSWPTWNIVEGPADRDDEGGTDVDLFEHGLERSAKSRFTSIKLLWQAMSAFLDQLDRPALKARRDAMLNAGPDAPWAGPIGTSPSASSAKALRTQLDQHGKVFKKVAIIPYREAMWKVTVAGRVHAKYPIWLRTPRFKKADGTPGEPLHGVDQSGKVQCPYCRHAFPEPPRKLPGNLTPCPKCRKHVFVADKNRFLDPAYQ